MHTLMQTITETRATADAIAADLDMPEAPEALEGERSARRAYLSAWLSARVALADAAIVDRWVPAILLRDSERWQAAGPSDTTVAA